MEELSGDSNEPVPSASPADKPERSAKMLLRAPLREEALDRW
jgi:hypothetical protein